MKLLSVKWLIISVIATSLLTLTACGTNEKAASNQGPKQDNGKKYHLTVGYLKANGAPLADIAIQPSGNMSST